MLQMLLEILRRRSVIDYEDLDTENATEHIKSILDFLQIKKVSVSIKVDSLFKRRDEFTELIYLWYTQEKTDIWDLREN